MKFLFFTDPHLTGKIPAHRIDNYPEAVLTKIVEVYEIAKDNDCKCVVLGGDLFNTHKVYSYDILNSVIEIIDGVEFPTFTIAGQHDLKGYNQSSYINSALAFVVKRSKNLTMVMEPMKFEGALFVPCNPWQDVEQVMEEQKSSSEVSVLIAHALLSEKTHMFEVIQTSKLPKSEFDIVVSGDLHNGYATHKIGKTLFCNPGALGRRSMDEADIHPSVALVDADRITADVVPLQNVKNPEDIFGVTLAEELREAAKFDASTFIKEAQALKSKQIDIYRLIESMGKKKKTRPEVISYILSKRDDEKVDS